MVHLYARLSTLGATACLLASSAFTQPGSWVQKADFGGGDRQKAMGFSIGTTGYLTMGVDETFTLRNDLWAYDQLTGAWTQKADFPAAPRGMAVGFAIGSKGYIGTGSVNNTYTSAFWEYDPATNTWTQRATFGGAPRLAATGFAIGNKGYIGTGYYLGTHFDDFWEYDPASDTWTQKADFAGGPRYGAVGFGIGNKGYMGTGYGSDQTNDFYAYDPATDTWSAKADVGGPTRLEALGFSTPQYGYVGTGYHFGTGYLGDFWEYDPVADAWDQKADFGGTARNFAVGFAIGTRGCIGTGENGTAGTPDFWEFTPFCIPGTPCDDGEECTANDLFLSDCGCAGTFQDTDSDGTCDAMDQCPGGPEPGTACDDGLAATYNDVIDLNCECHGGLCLATQLTTVADPVISCGTNDLKFNGTSTIAATEVPGANKYQFRFTNAVGQPAYMRHIAFQSRSFTLSKWLTNPLKAGRTYNVLVRASFDHGATWCDWGTPCTVQMSWAPLAPGWEPRSPDVVWNDTPELHVFPNPSKDDPLIISLACAEPELTTASLALIDLYGKCVMTATLPLHDGELHTTLRLKDDMPSGLYFITITAGELVFNERLVIAR